MRSGLSVDESTTEAGLEAVALCYEYAYLEGRHALGSRLPPKETVRLGNLRALLHNPDEDLRKHRRIPTSVPVEIRHASGQAIGRSLNLCGGGMLVGFSGPAPALPTDALVNVTLGEPGATTFTFPCRVVWRRGEQIGLKYSGVPLQIRYASYPVTRERPPALRTLPSDS